MATHPRGGEALRQRAPVRPPERTGRAHRYTLYGIPVLSEVALPLPSRPAGGSAAPVWTFRRAAPDQKAPRFDGGEVAHWRCSRQDHTIAVRYQRGEGFWIWNPAVATFHVSPGARQVIVYPELWEEDPLIGLTLAGEIAVLILQVLGQPSLHASAVLAGGRAAAFVGQAGQGKSTLGAYFLRRGAALLTDDCLPVRLRDGVVYGGPGLPIMKVWPETVARALEISHDLPDLLPHGDKKLLDLAGTSTFVEEPVRLGAVYALHRYDPAAAGRSDVSIRKLTGREGLTVLLTHTAYHQLMTPSDLARCLPLYSRLLAETSVRLLSYPNGFEHQPAVRDRILEDLESA